MKSTKRFFSSLNPLLHHQEYSNANAGSNSKVPLIFLHGLLGSSTNFRSIALSSLIQTNRRVIGLDLRNHGSSFHSTEMNLDVMVDDVHRKIESLNLGSKFALCGHSLGRFFFTLRAIL